MKKLLLSLLAAAFIAPGVALAQDQAGLEKKDSYRFVIIPKVVHPWFDKVNDGAKQAAAVIKAQTGADVQIDYSAPQQADVVQQNQILESSIATRPDGIAIDLLDEKGNRASLEEAVGQEIPVTIFDSVPPEGMELTSIGNDFCEQAQIASRRLVELLKEEGEVAIMMGVPSAPNHAIRAECHQKVFDEYPNIKVVATGIDNDDIETAQKQAAAIMQANPNLKGWVASDAAGPIGIGQAIQEAGKKGEVILVGLDNLPEMLQLIRDGVADSSSSTKPEMQGYWAVMTMWQKALGIETPKYIDTGIAILNKDNVGE
ncbi:monosaccharide ABC transporter substrate-binding protein (CUT2 family) [Pseudaminobacter salicylatoxidans]|uniref:Monosaccharide ABC transporter substrate-binding protein (CUT2 family) n=1 Tax=Pseudaminobacter salicylatoxidans TaxID=93369 RepID=A0A316CWI5_PSESE|nr:substrate-binding domain-containing protein [Pseudaminobacter salicylatoxidans]PWJ86454.1 monosaccharide ABC transporter substrate-binding protein (CUT2 family) [Pseudaminobacter salicylatoxidans]